MEKFQIRWTKISNMYAEAEGEDEEAVYLAWKDGEIEGEEVGISAEQNLQIQIMKKDDSS